MASSKSLPFLVIAGIILAAAIVWKVFSDDSPESNSPTAKPVDVPVVKTVEAKTDNKPVAKPQIQPAPVVKDPYSHLADMPKDEAVKEAKVIAQNNMKFAMRYPTVDKALSALKTYKNAGNDDMVKSLVSYIQVNFPKTTIPSEFLD